MKLLTGLFRAARKRLMTTDNDMGMFRQKLDELVEQKDSLSDEDVAAKVEELKGFTKDLPGDEDKAKLDRFLDDFAAVKEQDPAAAKEAAKMVADLFEKLDAAAMADVPAVEEPAGEEPAVEETVETEEVEETDAAPEEAGEEQVEEIAEETEAPAEDETKDEDPNPTYSLEEIYQFIKKRMAEDAAAGSEDEDCQDEAAEEVTEEEEEEVVTDHAPVIPVTFGNGKKPAGSLSAMFAGIKGDK